ncbi:MAG: phosphatase domain-containing protein [Desulfobacterales bacterium]
MRHQNKLRAGISRILHILADPAKTDRGRGGIVIQTYRGFGSAAEGFLIGRVFRQDPRTVRTSDRTLIRDIVDLLRRLFRKGISQAELTVRFHRTVVPITADKRGYFQAHFHYQGQGDSRNLWKPVHVDLIHPAGSAAGTMGRIFVPPSTARFAVISDIDDTVVFTGVADKLMMVWRLFMHDARNRTAFPGVGALYRAFHYGASGADINPMLYVSRGPWSIYEVLDEFFNFHGIPVGPILFLRDWGISLWRPFPRPAKGHKLALIRRMLALYHDLPFILIGDSGQRDPEIYTEIVRMNPGRVLAVYIRNLNAGALRNRAIEKLARDVNAAASTMLLAADSYEMAAHAADQGYISSAALSEMLEERRKKNVDVRCGRMPVRTGNRFL